MEPIVYPAILTTCPKCHGERVLRATNIFINGSNKQKQAHARFVTTPVSPVQALVCTNCGYLEIWANDLNKLTGH